MTDDDVTGRRPFEGAGDDRGRGGEPGSSRGERALRGLPRASEDDALAPVIPLFGGRDRAVAAHPSVGRDHSAAAADALDAVDRLNTARPRLRPLRDLDETAPAQDASDESAVRERAEAVLLRKLRSRSLSLSEARGVVSAIDGVDGAVAEQIIDRFVDLGYLDDATFAEQLAMSAVEKRGEGRRAVAETLRKRGISREVAEAALAELPDDDAERALEFARSKVRAVEGAEYDAALRRLAGQLARRGYPSSVSLAAARTALSEAGIGRTPAFRRPASGVRFTPDE